LIIAISQSLKKKIEKLPDVTSRAMFGYQCYSVNGKFFVGFSKKDKRKMIIRLSKDLQNKAMQDKQLRMKPFAHGARMGWVEFDMNDIKKIEDAFKWVKKGYDYALKLSER
jgi:predicted DNA-binding protein (MmcQ/YjbR family)